MGSLATGRPGVEHIGQSAGAKLISRVWLYVTQSWTVPAGATRCRAKCIGAGGQAVAQQSAGAGGGGAFAAGDLPVSPGQTMTISVGTVSTAAGGNGGDTSVVSGAKTVLAKGGIGTNSYLSGSGGSTFQCIGDIVRAGGNGGVNSGNGQAGVSGGGGASAINTQGGGGGSAGDMIDSDTLHLGGNGTSPGYNTAGPGGGGAANGSAGAGIAVLEFWSA